MELLIVLVGWPIELQKGLPGKIYLKIHSNLILSTQKQYKYSTLAETHNWWALKIAIIVLI